MIITINTIHPKLNTVRDQSSKDDISITSSLVPSLVMRYYANKNNENKCHTSKKLQTVQKPKNTWRMQKSPQNAQSNVDRTNQSKMWRYSSTLGAATASRLSELRVLLRYLDCHLLIPHNINVLHTHTVQHTTTHFTALTAPQQTAISPTDHATTAVNTAVQWTSTRSTTKQDRTIVH